MTKTNQSQKGLPFIPERQPTVMGQFAAIWAVSKHPNPWDGSRSVVYQ